MEEARIEVLGPGGVHFGDHLHQPAGRQPRLLLAYLALAVDRPVPTDELADVLWPDGPGEHWAGALRGVVSKVRATLAAAGPAGSALANPSGCYLLTCPAGVTIDVVEARRAVVDAERLLASDPAAATAAARQALALLDQPLLPDVHAGWAAPVRADLARVRQRARRAGSRAASARGARAEAIALAAEAATADPADEESCRVLMAAHLAAGAATRALAAYDACHDALVESLGSSPSPETEALQREARSRLLVAAAVEPRLPRAARALGVPFVGRHDARATLADLASVAAGGARQVVFVRGEAGAGKTRLVLETLADVHAVHVLFGRSDESRGEPYGPIADALARVLDELDDERRELLLGSGGSGLAVLAPGLGTPAPLADVDDRPRVFDAVRAVLERLAEEPTVLVLDDLQWADASTLLLLTHLVRRLEHARLLVIATLRDEPPPEGLLAEVLADLHRLDGVHTITLGGLDDREVAELVVASRLDRGEPFVRELQRRTRGNCLYLNQLIASTVETERPDRGAGFVAPRPSLGAPGQVPDPLHELVRHRARRLAPDVAEVLGVAAVAGTAFPADVLDAVVGKDVTDAVDELVARGWLCDDGAVDVAFSHGVVRDAVYRDVPEARRRELHLAMARAFRDPAGAAPRPVDWTAVSHHLVVADDAAHAGEAVEATMRAGQRALKATGYEEAAALYKNALDLADRHGLGDELAATISLGLGAAQRRAGNFASARVALARTLEVARRLDLGALFAEGTLELVAKGGRGVGVDLPDLERAALLQEAADRLGDREPALLVSVLSELALALVLWPDQSARQQAVAERARRTAQEHGTAELAVHAVLAERLLQTRPADAPRRLAATRDLVGTRRTEVSLEGRVRLHLWRIYDCYTLADRAGVEREQTALSGAADELGQPYWRWIAEMWRALHTFIGGEVDDADAQALAAVELVADLEHPETMLGYGIQHCAFRLQQRRGAEVVGLLRDAVASWPELVPMRAGCTYALAQAGELDEARHHLDLLAADGFRAVPGDINWAVTMTCVAEAAALLGDQALAATIIPQFDPYRDHFGVVSGWGVGACWGPIASTLGSLRACVGDREGAVADVRHALDLATRFGAPPFVERITADLAALER